MFINQAQISHIDSLLVNEVSQFLWTHVEKFKFIKSLNYFADWDQDILGKLLDLGR